MPTATAPALEEQLRALRQGCGFADRSGLGRLELAGKDRHRFLNAYVTCDVKDLAPAEGTEGTEGAYGFFTSPQGKILADAEILARAESFWLLLPPGRDEAIAEHLKKYVLADRVEVRPLPDARLLTLAGPGARAVLGGLSGDLAAAEAVVQRSGRLGVESFTLWVPASLAGELAERLAGRDDVTPVTFEALETLRVEAGIPRFGADFGPESFPQETGVEEAVSYTKGCYLGQEVVARIHYRGGVQKVLRGLVFGEGEEPPEAPPAGGTPLLHEGREAGTVGTAVRSVALGRPVGLAVLHRRAAEAGTRLEVQGGGTAEVRDLPLAP
jgi:folate-binding protein YgfZ